MTITLDVVRHIAALANLELSAEECEAMRVDLSAILEYIGQLDELDTATVEPMAHVLAGADAAAVSDSTMRADQARTWFTATQALANAPAAAAGFFQVPRIIAGAGPSAATGPGGEGARTRAPRDPLIER